MNFAARSNQHAMACKLCVHLLHVLPCVIFLLTECSASAAVIRDQFAPGSNGGVSVVLPTLERAQTFPVTIAGIIDHVEIWVNNSEAPAADTYWDIRPTIAGVPVASDSAVLASGVILAAEIPIFPNLPATTLDLLPFHIAAHPGDRLAITLRVREIDVEWRTNFGVNPGAKFSRSSVNEAWTVDAIFQGRAHGFASYVLTPEPSSYVLAIGGMALLLSAGYKRCNWRRHNC